MKNTDAFIRPIAIILLLIGAIVITVLMFIPANREMIKDPAVMGMLGMVVGFWFKDLSQGLAYYFGQTQDAAQAADKIATFAVTPGTVTNEAAPTAGESQ
jgi:hypothetical protein